MPDLDFFLQRNGISYSIERNDTLIHHSLTGVPNTETSSGKKYIGFTLELIFNQTMFLQIQLVK